jgi:two-component system chemotaxis response regulator CheY
VNRILIIDDSKAMRMIVARTVRQAGFGDCTIIEATNGAEGLAAVRAQAPDLVLCDWNMPEMSGYDLLEALNADGKVPPFGFITSEGTPEIKIKALKAGAAFLIVKPFTVNALQDAVRGLQAA